MSSFLFLYMQKNTRSILSINYRLYYFCAFYFLGNYIEITKVKIIRIFISLEKEVSFLILRLPILVEF